MSDAVGKGSLARREALLEMRAELIETMTVYVGDLVNQLAEVCDAVEDETTERIAQWLDGVRAVEVGREAEWTAKIARKIREGAWRP